MHKLSSSFVLRRFQIGAFLFIAIHVIVGVGVVLLGRGLAHHSMIWHHFLENHQEPRILDEWELWTGLGLLATSLLLFFVQRLMAGRAKCPLCLTPPLVHKSCQKNREARTFLGSYRLRVALSVLLLRRFTCPYCGEPTRCEVRGYGQSRRGVY